MCASVSRLSQTCTNCALPFTLLRRRHHCRFCGKVQCDVLVAFPGHSLHYSVMWLLQIFCNTCSSERMDGAQFGVSGSLRVCVKCKSFEKSMAPSKVAAAASGVPGPTGHSPPPPPYVPLFHPPTCPEDGSAQFDLESYGTDFIRTLMATLRVLSLVNSHPPCQKCSSKCARQCSRWCCRRHNFVTVARSPILQVYTHVCICFHSQAPRCLNAWNRPT
jgi:hypothetical protein